MNWKELFEYVIKPISRNTRSDLAVAAAIIAGVSTGEIKLPEELVKHEILNKILEKTKLEGNIRDRSLQILKNTENEEFRELLEEFFKLIVESPIFYELLTVMSTNTGFLNIMRNALHTLNMLKLISEEEIKTYLDRVSGYLDELEGFVTYYRVPKSIDEVIAEFRLPREWTNEKDFESLFIMDDRLREAYNKILNNIGEKIIIVGRPGVGKTALMFKVWKDLSKMFNTGILLPNVPIRRLHEEYGVILFYDDLPRIGDAALKTLVGVKNIIATAREHEFNEMLRRYPKLRGEFVVVRLTEASGDFLKTMLIKYLENAGIDYEEEAIKLAVEKARGAPIYLYHLYKELKAKKLEEGHAKLTVAIAKAIPEGTREYVGEILANVLRKAKGKYGILLALKSMTLTRTGAIHDAHFSTLYELSSDKMGEERDWDAFTSIHDILDYNPEEMTLRFPHDSWIDVLKGRSEAIAGLVHVVDAKVSDREKEELLVDSARISWERVIADAKYLLARGLLEETDARKVLSLANSILTNWETFPLSDLESLEKIAKEWRRVLGEMANYALEGIRKLTEKGLESIDVMLSEAKREIGLGNIDKAKELLNKILEIDPSNRKALNNLGVILFNEGREEEALRLFMRARTPIALYNAAYIHYKKGELDTAEKLFREALENGAGPDAMFNLALTLFRLGKKDEALKWIERYMREAPDDKSAERLRNLIIRSG